MHVFSSCFAFLYLATKRSYAVVSLLIAEFQNGFVSTACTSIGCQVLFRFLFALREIYSEILKYNK